MNFSSKPKKFKKYFKRKTLPVSLFSRLVNHNGCGLQSKINAKIKIDQFLLLIKLLKRCLKGFNKKNIFWLKVFPDISITKKPREIRMGRGKGPVLSKVAIVFKGQVFLEIKNINNILEFYLNKTINLKFPFLKKISYNIW
jgi:large subunit ribosomal protein L16